MSLSGSDAATASSVAGGETLALAVTRLYFANEASQAWRLEATGAAVLVRTNNAQLRLTLVDLRDRRAIFTCDVATNKDWRYTKDRRHFHSFPSQRDRCYAAFSFADESEADDFYDAVHSAATESNSTANSRRPSLPSPQSTPYQPQSYSQQQSNTNAPPQLPHRSPQSSLALPPTINKSSSAPMGPASTPAAIDLSKRSMMRDDSDIRKSDTVSSVTSTEKSSGGFMSMFGRKSEKEKKDKKDKKKKSGSGSSAAGGGKIDKNMISAPSNFEHVSHVGFNPNSGFTAQNIPMEWKAIFAKAGITEEQLADKKTAKFVQKFMKENSGATGMPSTAPR
ncbi:hypothetical protein HDU98_003773, partial [Podochytrium sp. JEL0797]